MGAIVSHGNTSTLGGNLQIEANKPLTLSDLGSDLDLPKARAEVTRLRTYLKTLTDERAHVFDTRPPAHHNLTLPIPTQDELQTLLDSQIAAKRILEARRRRHENERK